ncbi:aldo/keto reductase [Nocardioides panacis]|uniref:Aldo/keto reductase n=1 Tax=Nocardioides panacis TaxID=2849501 RepID=A0A975XZR6_9ACTN|nr:aldo/keto reductase [Nocardioides panacis]QWZ07549.1 aldo/keto reductase [Nocardioides panacis]
MELRRLGGLGHQSSVLIYGAAALGDVDQDTADASVQEALDGGINHFDVARDYGDAELRLAPWMPRIRDSIFLATKTGERDRDAAWAQINESLERLGTDTVDLLQLHAVGDLDELDKVTRAGGALEAALRAQEEGLVGAVGITGHSHTAPSTHLEALRRHPFASVLTPLNPALWQVPGYREDYEALVAEVQRQDAALMTIKTVARRNWPQGADQSFATWYEPQSDPGRIRAGVSWVLAHPEVTGLATPGDVRLLTHVLAAEADRMPVPDAEAVLAGDADYSSPFLDMPI